MALVHEDYVMEWPQSGERDLLLLLGDGDSPELAAQRLGLTPSALAVRLHRLRRRAETLDL